jgi:hypothetical protein
VKRALAALALAALLVAADGAPATHPKIPLDEALWRPGIPIYYHSPHLAPLRVANQPPSVKAT